MKQAKNEKSDVRIRISGLSHGIHEYHFSSRPETIGLDENFQNPVETDARLERRARQLYLKTEIQTTGRFHCDRCLEEFEQVISTGYSMFYMHDELNGSQHPPEEVQFIAPETAYIDLAEDIRQMITLSVPLKLLCSDECKGLCPRCGANLNRATCNCTEDVDDSRLGDFQRLMNR